MGNPSLVRTFQVEPIAMAADGPAGHSQEEQVPPDSTPGERALSAIDASGMMVIHVVECQWAAEFNDQEKLSCLKTQVQEIGKSALGDGKLLLLLVREALRVRASMDPSSPTTFINREVMKRLGIATSDEVALRKLESLLRFVEENQEDIIKVSVLILRLKVDPLFAMEVARSIAEVLIAYMPELAATVKATGCSQITGAVCAIKGVIAYEVLLSLVLAIATVEAGGAGGIAKGAQALAKIRAAAKRNKLLAEFLESLKEVGEKVMRRTGRFPPPDPSKMGKESVSGLERLRARFGNDTVRLDALLDGVGRDSDRLEKLLVYARDDHQRLERLFKAVNNNGAELEKFAANVKDAERLERFFEAVNKDAARLERFLKEIPNEVELDRLLKEIGSPSLNNLLADVSGAELLALEKAHGTGALAWAGQELTGTQARQLLTELGNNQVIQGMMDVRPETARKLLTDLTPSVIQAAAPQVKGSGFEALVRYLGPRTARDVCLWRTTYKPHINITQLAKQSHRLSVASTGAGELVMLEPIGSRSFIVDTNYMRYLDYAISKARKGDPIPEVELNVLNHYNALGADADLRVPNIVVSETPTLVNPIKRQGLLLTVSRDSKEYEELLERLLKHGVGGQNPSAGAADRAMVADAFFAETRGAVPTLVSSDLGLINGLLRMAGLQGGSKAPFQVTDAVTGRIISVQPIALK